MYASRRYSNDTYGDRRPVTNRHHPHPHPCPRPPYRPQQRLPPPPPPVPEPPKNQTDNFIIKLRVGVGVGFSRRNAIVLLIKQCCTTPPDTFSYRESGSLAGKLFFTEWTAALNAVVLIWETRLAGSHKFTPTLEFNVTVPSDVDELNSRLRPVFSRFIQASLSCEVMLKLEAKKQGLWEEIKRISEVLRKQQPMNVYEELDYKRKRLKDEKGMILKRIEEFKGAMECIKCYIHGLELNLEFDDRPPAFRFKPGLDWARIYSLIMRECRRFEDGLPIYVDRRELLKLVQGQQIMVLVGETGSGKSTQLVQFLADSGLVGDGSIVCTQPRKIAAISLQHRVQEESHGCYEENYITCVQYYSSAQQFESNLIYMTDHCLLQHCMNDGKLKGISCILVDEAHERSLNTDLLLAMLKGLLPYRPDLRLIIMSATADAYQLSEYFFDCKMVEVIGRKFPVDVKYVPCFEGTCQSVKSSGDIVAHYVSSTVKMVTEIHRTEQEGTILAFLTSPIEVEWACESLKETNAEPLALHGKLPYEDQLRVFQNYPGKRKIIFATNVAETSLTIPGVKFVVDSGMMKESRFEPGSGMNVLSLCQVSQSSAIQRAGRAGRTEPGRCYRLYSHGDFCKMAKQQKPEICRVHLGVAVLKIVAMGVKNVREFNFIDMPDHDAIDKAIQNLLQLGAVTLKNGDLELTDDGSKLVKLGIEPRLGKLILCCLSERLGREGLVLAALMPNHSSIFCRVGNQSDKLKSDCLKVRFCHADGDLFTLLSVFKAWESERPDWRNGWCWENSINAKSMRRCYDTVSELENCLKNELHIVVPSYWNWTPDEATVHHKNLKKAILASLAENVAMFSGCDRLGYVVALTGKHVQLHPSCSLLMFSQKADWVVFGEVLDASCQYLVCVTAFDREFLSTITPPPLFDPCGIKKQKLQLTKWSGLGKTILKKFCGRSNNGLLRHVSRIRENCGDDRIRIEVDTDNNTIEVFSGAYDVEKVLKHVNDALDCERRWLLNECMERCLYHGSPSAVPPVALFGSGAEIKHLELDKRCLTVDVFHSNASAVDDKELLLHIDRHTSGIDVFHPNVSAVDDKELLLPTERHTSGICSFHKYEGQEKWGSITFLTPGAAIKAAELNNIEFYGGKIRINLSRVTFGMNRAFSFPVVRAKLFWPRRLSKGFGIVKCDIHDVGFVIRDLSDLLIGKRNIRCEAGKKSPDSVVITGIDRLASETEILQALRSATDRTILDFFLVREDAVDNPPCHACEEVLFRELSAFMPKGSPQINFCRVRVFSPDPKHAFMKALVTFDGRLYFEAAKALEQIEGTTLPGFQPWQKIQCQRLFHTSVSCPSFVYSVIKSELDLMVTRFNRQKGAKCIINKNNNGSVWVKISATATKIVAELRSSLEELMKGRTISHASLTPDVLQVLFSRDGNALMRALERAMEVSVSFDRQRLNLTLFGPSEKVLLAEERFIRSIVNLHEERRQVIHLRGVGLPHDLMREVVRRFGHDLRGLKDKVPDAEFSLDTRRHVIFTNGSEKAKQKAEEIINEIAQASGQCPAANNDNNNNNNDGAEMCPICFCKVENAYKLERCLHVFCKPCLVKQCECAIRNKDSFPLNCLHEGCKLPILLVDLKELVSSKQLDELFEASLAAFVSSSCGAYRFCPSPDCPNVYKVADADKPAEPFSCGACYAETCTKCHLEYHPNLSCDKYKEYKEDPDASLKEWTKGKDEFVKKCPGCGYTIEKAEGCNHVECKCGRHLCWVCLEHFLTSEDCYSHLRTLHQGIT
ncbi:ATP-dependent RNA helicase DEAH12, chloroplastic-like [Silene latifolia]|uniref:ATP-dependent RNA helicase DEAH12, chloroplastic-like n=1 Tax=Silene latifolia TaxID=37657 RepID=UPI003D77496C